ncbi:hypothetical protein C8T65DRAFT_239742 [Cerioporus squamosus]|nr:hypothetical protein C8T65DRAFT_239742 [Cerioporus squamosus]
MNAADAAAMPTMMFSSVGMEVLSSVVHLVGVSILSYMLALKLKSSDFTFSGLHHITWARLLVLLNLIDSWAFLFTSKSFLWYYGMTSCCWLTTPTAGVLVHGAGMELSETVCLLGVLNCIVFYGSSKVIIYLFLAEKVLVVWNPHRRRFHSKVYVGCLGVLVIYLGVVIYLILGRVALFRDDGACVIGLTRSASLALLIYDLCINVILTSLFVWPLLKRDFGTKALRAVAIRTLWAAGVALTTSCINILVLTIMHGRQLAWVCLASCGTDVVINAMVLCWVTSGKHEKGTHSHEPGSHGDHNAYSDNVVLYSGTTSGDSSHSEATLSAMRSRLSNAFHGRSRGSSISKSMDAHPAPEVQLVRVSKTDIESLGSDIEVPRDDLVSSLSPIPSVSPANNYGETPLCAPLRAHSSTVKRSNTVLSRGLAEPSREPPMSGTFSPTARSSQSTRGMQIIVMKETDVLTDGVIDTVPRQSGERPSPPESNNSEIFL